MKEGKVGEKAGSPEGEDICKSAELGRSLGDAAGRTKKGGFRTGYLGVSLQVPRPQ